jgi:soluble lytic murein transglycosylase
MLVTQDPWRKLASGLAALVGQHIVGIKLSRAVTFLHSQDPNVTFGRLRKRDNPPAKGLNSCDTFGKREGVGAIYFLQANSEGNRGAIFKRGKPFAGRRLRRRVLICLLGLTIFALASADALPAAGHKQVSTHASKTSKAESHKDRPLTEAKRVATHRSKASKAESQKHRSGNEAKQMERAPGPRTILATDSAGTVSAPQLSPNLVTLKQAIRLVQQHKLSDATKLAASIEDPAEQKLLEWALLRDPDNPADFDQYNRFIQANPDWPSIPLLRRRAEARLWQERRDAVTVRRFIGTRPASAVGRLAIARLLLDEGDRAGASREVRTVWHSAELSAELETVIANTFGDELTPADDIVRMDRRIGAKDFAAAMRAAKRLGSAQVAIVKACEQAEANGAKSGALLEAVPKEAQADLGYALCRLHWLLAHDDVAAAVKLVTEASDDDLRHQDTDEWWRECRTLARRLLDLGDPNTAYRVVREAAAPANPYYRAEFHFMPGWIALRFLSDPITALRHFAKVDEGSSDPIVLARAAYWRGRAFEAADQSDEMKTQYERAARYPTSYYGQLARARIGLSEIALRPPSPSEANLNGSSNDVLRAADMLYMIGELDLVLTFVTELAESSTDPATLSVVGELTARRNDAQAMLVLGKTALARGLAMERYAFPEIGVPTYSPIAPAIDDCMVYSIVRTESGFDQRDTSPANAVGLMQVTPEAGRDTTQRFGVAYDWKRLVADPVYNTQMGAAEVSALFKEYTGSYLMTFAGYNAGRGRVRQWVAQHGDPRDPKVDPVDWVERIPMAETRNYVQRVMENLQVYAVRLGATVATVEPNLHRVTTIDSRAKPVLVDAIPH